MGVPEGKVFKTPILEYSYKNDDLHDPFINHYYALALDLATQEELDTIAKYAFKVNEVLKKIMLDANIRLVDFKLEFGRLSDGTIILADEISPDTCRFWDSVTHEKLDKDRFRRDLGGVEDAYQEVMRRLSRGIILQNTLERTMGADYFRQAARGVRRFRRLREGKPGGRRHDVLRPVCPAAPGPGELRHCGMQRRRHSRPQGPRVGRGRIHTGGADQAGTGAYGCGPCALRHHRRHGPE